MVTANLTKVGNSSAVFIPAALRREAGIALGDALTMESPRSGVIVLTFPERRSSSKLAELEAVEKRIAERGARSKPWPEGKTADDLVNEAREERLRELHLT